jgi:hypothetical protein
VSHYKVVLHLCAIAKTFLYLCAIPSVILLGFNRLRTYHVGPTFTLDKFALFTAATDMWDPHVRVVFNLSPSHSV